MNSKHAIGIFDSGIGGLTVAKAIRKLLPLERLIYFGDTAHLPYGDKSPVAIRNWSKTIAEMLLKKKVKLIVIACNTASAHAYASLRAHLKGRVEVIDVINPTAEYVAKKFKKGKVGVIGTKGTINSRVYVKRIEKLNPKLKVTSNATPLLAPMVEEGFFNNNISKTIIRAYLDKKTFQNIDAIILGCTHYPLIKREIKEVYNDDIEVIDSAQKTAEKVKSYLSENGLLSKRSSAKDSFYVSDLTESFDKSTKVFFKQGISLKKLDLWK
ncbi:MAG: glutamate racemase [Flavobacteriales bacterium]|nr:glutamate racemase [Flavobacteriales bacterium]